MFTLIDILLMMDREKMQIVSMDLVFEGCERNTVFLRMRILFLFLSLNVLLTTLSWVKRNGWSESFEFYRKIEDVLEFMTLVFVFYHSNLTSRPVIKCFWTKLLKF